MSTPGSIPLGSHHRAALRIQRLATRHHDSDALLRALAAEVRSITASPAVVLAHCGPSGEELRWLGIELEGERAPALPWLDWKDSLFRRVAGQPSPQVVDLGARSGRREEVLDLMGRFGAASACLLPLSTPRRSLGTLAVSSRSRRFFSDSALRRLVLLAGQAAQAIDYMLAAGELGRLERESLRLRLLLDLGDAVASESDSAPLVNRLFPRIRRLARIDAVALILPDTGGRSLHVRMLDFPGRAASAPGEALPSDSIAGRVFRTGQHWTGNPRALDWTGGPRPVRDRQFGSVCVFPLLRSRQVLGVLGLGRLEEEPFSHEDVEFLSRIADQLAIAVAKIPSGVRGAGAAALPAQPAALPAAAGSGRILFGDIVGSSAPLQKVLRHLETVAPAPTTVLISGETGTGKEMLAEAIHQLSPRRGGPLVKVNCAALPAGLLESELFGHERGAFTGAHAQRIGRFELASQGTLFLDEISELPLELQPKLLRVLQEKQFERIGSSRALTSNARILAASNRDLKAMVAEGRFRADLYYRLSVFPLHLPPLRERREDIPLLVEHFVRHFGPALGRPMGSVSAAMMAAFCRYSWPGNIRELQNAVERAVLLSPADVLDVAPEELDIEPGDLLDHEEPLEEIERRRILSVLELTDWVISGPEGAAARLGMKRSTLQFRMKKLGLARPRQSA